MDTLDKLKQQWIRTSIKPDANRFDLIDKTTSRRLTPSRERIATRLCVTIAVCLVVPIFIPLCRLTGVFDFPHWFSVVYTTFFLIMAALQCVLYRVVSTVNFSTMTVTEAIGKLVRYRRLKMRFKAIGIVLGVITVSLMFYAMGSAVNTEIVIGAWIGAVLGGTIGLLLDRRDRRLITGMLDDLNNL